MKDKVTEIRLRCYNGKNRKGALSIQQKFRFEISQTSRAQWNGTFRLHRPDPSQRLGHFGPTDRNDQTSHSGPPSKLIPNIPVGPNRNGSFHLMYQPKLPEYWVEWKAPKVFSFTRKF